MEGDNGKELNPCVYIIPIFLTLKTFSGLRSYGNFQCGGKNNFANVPKHNIKFRKIIVFSAKQIRENNQNITKNYSTNTFSLIQVK